MSLRLQRASVATGGHDTEGLLIFHADVLTAVIVRLSDDHEDEAGKWFLEVGFGPLEMRPAPTFTDLDEAQDWILHRLEEHRRPSLTSETG